MEWNGRLPISLKMFKLFGIILSGFHVLSVSAPLLNFAKCWCVCFVNIDLIIIKPILNSAVVAPAQLSLFPISLTLSLFLLLSLLSLFLSLSHSLSPLPLSLHTYMTLSLQLFLHYLWYLSFKPLLSFQITPRLTFLQSLSLLNLRFLSRYKHTKKTTDTNTPKSEG